ncbi:MAG TPA: hypothetical protein H9805_13440 [Candidatus Janibacter merdipullorum]|nr:hypothetical protein [Candidatus Janibacter merdipullorum]
MAAPHPPAPLSNPPAPVLRVRDLTQLEAADVVPVLTDVIESTDGGASAIERVIVLTDGRVPEQLPELTTGASRAGLSPDQVHVSHTDDYVPAPPSTWGADDSPASGRPHSYELYRRPAAPEPAGSLGTSLDSPLVVVVGSLVGGLALLLVIVLVSVLM